MKAIDSSNIHLFNPSYKPPEVFSRLKLEKRCLLKGVEAARRRVGGRGPLFKSTTQQAPRLRSRPWDMQVGGHGAPRGRFCGGEHPAALLTAVTTRFMPRRVAIGAFSAGSQAACLGRFPAGTL